MLNYVPQESKSRWTWLAVANRRRSTPRRKSSGDEREGRDEAKRQASMSHILTNAPVARGLYEGEAASGSAVDVRAVGEFQLPVALGDIKKAKGGEEVEGMREFALLRRPRLSVMPVSRSPAAHCRARPPPALPRARDPESPLEKLFALVILVQSFLAAVAVAIASIIAVRVADGVDEASVVPVLHDVAQPNKTRSVPDWAWFL
uniref:Uncharacterized protein n=1 Tax=Oryza punctata TaxID=4537 RepID=A0A0E0JRK3_ORYPU